jgi:murein DD-endopeptidase MepM/ murein hydrolase activator NlpD
MLMSMPSMVYASSTDKDKEAEEELENQKNDLKNAQQEKSDMEGTLSDIKSEKENLEQAKDDLSDYVVELDGQLMTIQDKLTQLETKIAEKELEVEQIQEQLRTAEENEANQYASMKQRIKFMYENGNQAYVDMLFGAESFADMMNKAEYIAEMSDYDRNMLVEYQNTKTAIEQLKDQLEQEQEALLASQDEANQKEGEMSDLIDQKQAQIESYETDISNKEQAIKEYEAEIAAQNATIAALENQIAQAEAAQRQKDVSGNSVETTTTASVYSGGAFCWPAPSYTRISDDYGNRMHPTLGVMQFHNGLDMAAPGGSSILAAADGTVVAASYSSTMGNYIMINHGSGLYTIYMHASALYVSAGQSVSKGQKIAAVGSTGRSTGNHLHFSVRQNGSYVSPWNFLR